MHPKRRARFRSGEKRERRANAKGNTPRAAAFEYFRANKFALGSSNHEEDYISAAGFDKFGDCDARFFVVANTHRRLVKLPIKTWITQGNVAMKLRIASDNSNLS
ncbi:hypothetical protein ASE06_21935 [Sphingopyxis sp. Root214]|nr:hypothetical protein ASD73_19600 [Sphingopyxis sp. Root154]KRC05917.1 hypothetical protein ASE06_21935 [Sphingopyxis sp. Root214]